jgi:hypothetical protein
MFILNWSSTYGTAAANGQPWVLRTKPDIAITFDSLSYSMGGGSKTVGTQTVPLSSDEVLRIEQWIAAQNPHQTTDDLVHGADANGHYLGLVPKAKASIVLLGPPPSGVGWRWDVAKSVWVRSPTLQEASEAALRDIDLAAGQARMRYITEVPGQQATYLTKAEQATAFKAAGFKGEAPSYVKVEAQATGLTLQQAAETILATKAEWDTVGPRIEYLRRSGKIAVAAAQKVEDIETTARKTLAALASA